jgi:DNA-binding beta-propeller fold protein YncE
MTSDGDGHLFAAYQTVNGTAIGEFSMTGTQLNQWHFTGLDSPYGLAVVGTDIFVANFGNNTVGEYTTSGATINASLITGLSMPIGLAVTGNGNLLVLNATSGTVGEYTLSGLGLVAQRIWWTYRSRE